MLGDSIERKIYLLCRALKREEKQETRDHNPEAAGTLANVVARLKELLTEEKRYAKWKYEAQAYAQEIHLTVTGDDVFADDDPFDLVEDSKTAFETKVSPRAFIRDMFAEDLAEREADEERAKGR